MVFKQEKF